MSSLSLSSSSSARRRRPSEFILPSGRKVLVAVPEEAAALRHKYEGARRTNPESGIDVEVVVHGSPEHRSLLQQSQTHHEMRVSELRARHGAAFAEWEAITSQLHSVTAQLERIADHSASLKENFSKFGYDAMLRTYADDDDSSTEVGSISGGGAAGPGGGAADAGAGGGGDGGGKRPPLAISRSSSHSGDDDQIDWSDRHGGEVVKLFKRPVIKQYFHRGLLWRASEETRVMSFELFFDLLYVGIIAINGDHAAEQANGRELLRFVITFCMSWKIWSDVAQLVSWFETNDIAQRVEILFLIACQLGMTTNMLQTFNEEYDTYTQLVGFYLAARFFMGTYCILTAYLLPLVRGMMYSQVAMILIPSAVWIGSVHVEYPNRVALIAIALFLDLMLPIIVATFYRWSRTSSNSIAKKISNIFEFFPAINIEHKVERTNAFVTLVFGYSVVGVLYQNAGFGINAFLGKAILGLIQAYVFNWLYFEIDGSNIHTHAIRRHIWSATCWQYAHLMLILSYILSAAALSKLVVITDYGDTPLDTLTEFYQERSEEEVWLGLRFFYCSGMAVSLFSMGFISFTHHHKIPPTCRLPKWVRLANRFGVVVILLCLPAAQELNSLSMVSVATALVVWVLLVELFGTSRTDQTIFGDEKPCKYTARCTKKQLEEALRNDGDIEALDEKHGVVDVR